jgi:ABC-2 type transport system ATP-binding protein
MTATDNILEIRDLDKDYRSDWTFRPTRVLDSLNLEVRRGECFGLLGPNGAGKTTTFKLVLGFLRPTSGEIFFDGRPITPACREVIGFLPEHPYFYEYLTVQETLSLFASLYGIPRSARRQRIDEVIERVGLEDKRRASMRSLSKGLMQRVGVAQAILNRPRLVVFDEPMSGLDPVGRRLMRELICDIRDQGASIIFSSHILPDVEAICDRVGILTAGRLREVITLAEHAGADHFELSVQGANGAVRAALAGVQGATVREVETELVIRLAGDGMLDLVVDLVRRENGSIKRITPHHTSLEERFLKHVGS